jgi:hypothetical protein
MQIALRIKQSVAVAMVQGHSLGTIEDNKDNKDNKAAPSWAPARCACPRHAAAGSKLAFLPRW